MDFIKKTLLSTFVLIFILNLSLKAEEEEILLQAVADQIQAIVKDLKTLEKAVYQKSDISNSTTSISQSDGLNEDILTKHLLKLNEIENQFRELTNKFEEVNFKLDKLSSRVTKIQSDTQLRFSDLENLTQILKKIKLKQNFRVQANLKILELTQDTLFQIYLTDRKLILSKVPKLLLQKSLKKRIFITRSTSQETI